MYRQRSVQSQKPRPETSLRDRSSPANMIAECGLPASQIEIDGNVKSTLDNIDHELGLIALGLTE